MSKRNKSLNGIFQNFALVSQIGVMMVVPIIAGVVIGAFLDNALKTKGIFLLIFILIGVGSSFRNLYTLSMQKIKEYDKDETPSTYVNKYEKSVRANSKDSDSKKEDSN